MGPLAGILDLPEATALRELDRDGRRLFLTRVVRMFAYGLLAVVLALYLAEAGLDDRQIGLVLSLTLAGDAVVSLWITTRADRRGRRRMLLIGAGLMVLAGAVFASTRDPLLLTLAAIVGVISPSGSEVGPFQAIEQAALPETAPGAHRTQLFAWYNLAGYLAGALGALVSGLAARELQAGGATPIDSYRAVLLGYAACGALLALAFATLSPRVEVAAGAGQAAGLFGLHRSRGVVARFAALSAIDSFAGGLVVQALIAYWFHIRFGVDPGVLGAIFFGTSLLAGISALAAARIAARIGLLETMVFTHIPSNLLLMLVPLMPSLPLAIATLLARSTMSQMDVPTRQSYLVAVVDPDERSSAAGVTGMARTLGSAGAPLLSGLLLAGGALSAPFILSGALKIAYDLGMLRGFRAVRPPEEQARPA
ncbi:MAG TPA: MFS transporter [Chloroflexota bacterium]